MITHAAAIINKHFSEAIHNKEAEIDAIEDSILEAQKALHLLRYGSVSRTYSNFKDMVNKMFIHSINLSMRETFNNCDSDINIIFSFQR